jgi:hypothetical protein
MVGVVVGIVVVIGRLRGLSILAGAVFTEGRKQRRRFGDAGFLGAQQ